MSFPTSYQEVIIVTSQPTKRVFNIKSASDDSTVERGVYLEDVTPYTQRGTSFGATDLNNITGAINNLTIDITEIHVSQNLPAQGVQGGLYFTFS